MSQPLRLKRRDEPFGEVQHTPSAESGSVTAESATQVGGIREPPATDIPEGYKRTETGVIPESWTICEIGDLIAFKNGLNKAKSFFGIGTRIVNYMDVFERPGLISDDLLGRVTLTRDEISNYRVKMGDVFFTRTSETVEDIGIAAVMLDDPVDTVFSGFILRARPRGDRLNDAYKQYCFASRSVRSQVVSSATYTTRALTNGSSLSAVQIALPSLLEQRAIAAVLMDVDALMGSLEALIAKKRAIKRATMQQLLTGRTRLPGFRGEWETKRLGDHLRFLRHGSFPRSFLTPTNGKLEGGAKYLHYGDIHTSERVFLDPSANALPTLAKDHARRLDRLSDGDLVFVDASEDIRGVGKSIEIMGSEGHQLVSGLHTIAVRFNKAVLADGFKAYLQFCPRFRDHLRRLAAGTKVYATNRAHITSAELRVPPLPEQRAIASVLSDMDAGIEALERRLDKTRAVKQGMMQQLLTGTIRLPIPDGLVGESHDA